MSTPAILAYLESNPAGAKPAEIAASIGKHVNVVCVLLGRLCNNDQVTRHGVGRSRLNATWRLAGMEPPKTFGAAETLAAMQAACMARLLDQPALRTTA
jgi:hypothetical protein